MIWSLLLCLGFGAPSAQGPPNVIIITIDTLRADRLSAYGYAKNTSPNIDKLLARGVRFDQHRTVEPLTGPALTSMLTSYDPHEHGASRNGLRIYPDLPSLGTILAARGYRTAAFVGNWTLKDEISGLGSHFQEYHAVLTRKRWFGFYKGEADAKDLTDQALEWLGEYKRPAPFFLWVHYVDPHAPYRFRKEFAKRLGLSEEEELPRSDRYDTEIAFTDRHVGRLLEGVSRKSRPENTLIIFTADHGESLGEHDYWGHGRHLYEPNLHIPLGVVWSGTLPPRTIQAPSLITDIAPTVLSLVGISSPTSFRGFDWWPVLQKGAEPPYDRITHFQAHKGAVQTKKGAERGRQRGLLEVAVLHNGVKEILRVKHTARKVYDLNDDPLELKSLVKKNSELSDAIKNWALAVEHGLLNAIERPDNLTEDDLEMLRSLGYIE